MARWWTACVLLLLAASALTVSADVYTDGQIAGMISSNCLYRADETAPAGAPSGVSRGLTQDKCAACINSFSTPSSTVEDGTKIEACFNLCQDPLNQLPGLTYDDAATCVSCLSAASRESCRSCLALDKDASSDCMTYWVNGPQLTNASAIEEPSFVWAVAECHKFPTDNNVRSDCLSCLEAYTWDNSTQTQYFGKCIDAQQQAAYIANGDWTKVNGIYAMCGSDANINGVGLTPGQCYSCMKQVEALVLDPITAPKKAYGCAEYCQQEVNPIAAKNSTFTTRCTECLASASPADAWSCGNCAINTTFIDKGDCYDCVLSDPYEGKTSNYNWACAECSKIANDQLRALCLQCIRSQPLYVPQPANTSDPSYQAYLDFTQNTEANICSCVDLTWHAGSMNELHPGVETISVNRTLNAFELKCFMPQYNYSDAGSLEIPTIPWGADILPYYGQDGNIYQGGPNGPVLCPNCNVSGGPIPAYGGINFAPTTACVECVDATARTSTMLLPKQYACSEYCQDPATIISSDEGQDCSDCVTDARVVDPSDCKACIAATNHLTGTERTSRRQECFVNLRSPRSTPGGTVFPNYGWGVSQCSTFANATAREYCFTCVRATCEDPCVCVDAARRTNTSSYNNTCSPGGGTPPPSGGGCVSQSLWFWTWAPRTCTSDCYGADEKLPASGTPQYNNWHVSNITSFEYKIMWRSTPNTASCTQTTPGGAVGGPNALGCNWKQLFPTTIDQYQLVSGNAVEASIVANQLSDTINTIFYDVFAVRIDMSAFNSYLKDNAACDGDCQFFLVVTNATSTAPNQDVDYISWDNTQTQTKIGLDDTGYQNSIRSYAPFNGIAIEVDNSCGQIVYTSLAPYPNSTNADSLWQGSGNNTNTNLNVHANTVWRLFQILPPLGYPTTQAHN